MTKRRNLLIGTCLTLACVAWISQRGCGTSGARFVAFLSWKSPEMRAIEKDWRAICDLPADQVPGDDGKTKYVEKLRIIERLFRNRLSEQNVYQLVGSCDDLPVSAEDRGFQDSVLAFLVKVLVELGDREALVALLSTRSPTWFDGIEPIEYHLVARGDRLIDPVLILGDAYSRCDVPETRRTLAAAVRRGFAKYGIGGWGDADYVNNAMQWYEKEKTRLDPNWRYGANEISPIKYPLFKDKSGSAQRSNGAPLSGRLAAEASAAVPPSLVAAPLVTSEKDFARLQGTWKIVSATRAGRSLPKKASEGVEFVFQHQMLAIHRPGIDDDESAKRFRVRVGRDGKLTTIDIISVGEPERDPNAPALLNDLKNEATTGIYESHKDSLRLCLARPGAWRRPTSLAVPDSDTTVIGLSRVESVAAAPWPLKEISNSIGMRFVFIPAGEFSMGAPDDESGRQDDEIPRHPVRITKPFWLGACKVTRLEYRMGDHRIDFRPKNLRRSVRDNFETRNFPQVKISWYAAANFCNRLSDEERFPRYYRLVDDERGTPRQAEEVGGPGYRLPTEAEWEYVYRAATGWYDTDSGEAEWCNDIYDGRYYVDCPIEDPHGPARSPSSRPLQWREMVVRGGDAVGRLGVARVTWRKHHALGLSSPQVGFRVARDDSGDWYAKLRDVVARDAAPALTGHADRVNCVAFSPDGKTLASASDDRTVKLWNVASRACTATLEGHRQHVLSVAFNPDGKTVASAGEDAAIQLWDVATGANTATLKGHTRGVACLAYSPDGKTLASGSWDKTIRLWDVATGEGIILRTESTHTLRYSPDGKTLAAAGGGGPRGAIRFLDAAAGERTANSEASMVMISCLAYGADGKTLASVCQDPTIRLWDVASGKNVAVVRQEFGQINAITYSPDGQALASAAGAGRTRDSWSEETTVRLWDLAAGTSKVVLRGRPTGFCSLAFSPDGATLAAGGIDGAIRLIDARVAPSPADGVGK